MVQVKNVGTGATQSLTTDAQGRFRVSDLGVGEYEVQASKTGFSTVVHKGITLAGRRADRSRFLASGRPAAADRDGRRAGYGGGNHQCRDRHHTSEQQMRELPLNGRNFEQLIQLAPGVATVQFANNAMQGRAAQYSVAGSRPEGQSILLDDENLQSFWNNGISSITGSSLGVEAIGEFQTLTNSFGAQFGGNGAVINAVSKSGTNAFHGSGVRLPAQQRSGRSRFLPAHAQQPAAVPPQSVRRQPGRSREEGQGVLLCGLRRHPATAAAVRSRDGSELHGRFRVRPLPDYRDQSDNRRGHCKYSVDLSSAPKCFKLRRRPRAKRRRLATTRFTRITCWPGSTTRSRRRIPFSRGISPIRLPNYRRLREPHNPSEAARFPIGPERITPCRNTRPSRSGTLFRPLWST